MEKLQTKMFRLVIVALFVSATSGRKFQNPGTPVDCFDGNYFSPGVLLYRGLYYVVTNANSSNPDKIPMQVSSGLENWNPAGYALPENYIPAWSNGSYFAFPELHQIGESEFRLVFTAVDSESGHYAIGVGYSQTVLGPYIVTNQPLASNATRDFYEPTLVQDGAHKYLIWREVNQIFGRELNADCLGFAEGSEEKVIMKSDATWEGGSLASPWFVRRPDGWYMFYSAGIDLGVGVARGQNPLEPFEKRGNPILESTYAFTYPGFCSVVSDIFIGATVMVYQASPVTCGHGYPFIISQSVEWGADGWPYMNPY